MHDFLFQEQAGVGGAGAGVAGRQTAENDAASLPLRTDKHASSRCSPTANEAPNSKSQLQIHATQSPKQTKRAWIVAVSIISGNDEECTPHDILVPFKQHVSAN